MVDTQPRQVLTCLFLLALVLNLLVLIIYPPLLPNGEFQIGQSYRWWPLTLNLINGRGYAICTAYFPFCGPGDQPTASMEPVPVLFFGAIALLTHQSLLAACFGEILANLTLMAAVYTLTRQLAGNRTALLAAGLWATYLPALKLIPQISGDLVGAALLALALVCFLRAQTSQRWAGWIGSGLFLGLAIQSRSALLILAPVLFLGLLAEGTLQAHTRLTKFLKYLLPALTLLGLVIATQLPWIIRNLKTFHSPILGTTLTGYVLYRHNYILGENHFLHIVGADEALGMMKTFLAQHPELGKSTTEVEMNSAFQADALKIIRAYPARYLALSLYRFFPLWFNWGVDQAYGNQPTIPTYLLMVEQAILLFAALRGAWLTGKRSWPLWTGIMAVTMAYMAFNAQLRYLVPVLPFVISLAAIGFSDWLMKLTASPHERNPATH